MIRMILVALDESSRAPAVFRAAVEMASRFQARIQPLRAITVPAEFPAAAAGSRSDPLLEHLSKLAVRDIEQLATGGVSVCIDPPIVRVGEPSRIILEVSEDIDADLIVIGSHGYHALDRVLGTTAGRVANQSTRSVLVVHERVSRLAKTLPAPPKESRN
jgi:nucleotide-binding universal stress UspA family protein